MKKILLALCAMANVAFAAPTTYAVTPLQRTLQDDVETSQPIFVGMAKRFRVIKIRDVGPDPVSTPPNALPDPPGLYRYIQVEVQIVETLKSGKKKLPKKLTVRTVRVFSDRQEMQQEIAAMEKNLINHKHIYLVHSKDYFSIEDTSKQARIKAFIKKKAS